ncbi:hypothetical protein ACFZDK_55210 [Streptomyces sp. NPDC007901]|uniref:hypothetical protein n=1 Tax=Streptomyces sp. NPDC007901 TaxID=3364785 RepID=UPI0036EBF081
MEVRPGQTPAHSQPLIPYTTTRDAIRHAGGPAVFDGLQLSGVGLFAQVLPHLRAQYGGLAGHVDRDVPRLLQLGCPPLRMPEHEEQFVRGRELLERWVAAQFVQFPQALDDLACVDLAEPDRGTCRTGLATGLRVPSR